MSADSKRYMCCQLPASFLNPPLPLPPPLSPLPPPPSRPPPGPLPLLQLEALSLFRAFSGDVTAPILVPFEKYVFYYDCKLPTV